MGFEACRYVVVRFVPDVVRDEPLNMGVILQCPQRHFVEAKFTAKFTRIAKLYPDIDLNLIRSFAKYLAERIEDFTKGKQLALGEHPRKEPISLASPEFLDFLFQEYGGAFQFTKPQPTLAEDLQSELSSLFNIFVEVSEERERLELKRAPVTHPRVLKRVRQIFEEAKVIDYLQPKVRVTGKRWEYEFDFAYVNSHKGLIQSVAFDLATADKKISQAFWFGGAATDVLHRGEYQNISLIIHPPDPERAEGYEEARGYLNDSLSGPQARIVEIEKASEYAEFLRRMFQGPTLFDK